MTATLHPALKSTQASARAAQSLDFAAPQSVRVNTGFHTPAHETENDMATQKRAYSIHATTGIAESAYGGNAYLQLHAPDAPRSLATERHLAAATYRAAAEIEERILDASTCAVCVEATEARIHLEFAERATQAEQAGARAVLDEMAGEINRRANRSAR